MENSGHSISNPPSPRQSQRDSEVCPVPASMNRKLLKAVIMVMLVIANAIAAALLFKVESMLEEILGFNITLPTLPVVNTS